MKRYLLFAGGVYYPVGGWGDFIGDFDTIEEARLEPGVNEVGDEVPPNLAGKAKEHFGAWRQIVDTDTAKIVEESEAT